MRRRLALLSKPDLLALADISYQMAMTENLDAAQGILGGIKGLVPVAAVLCALARLDIRQGLFEVKTLLNLGYPLEWLTLYKARRYDRVDPVLRIHYAHYVPQVWSHTYKTVTVVAERHFIEASMQFGLKEGFTWGLACDAQGCGSVLSFVGDDFAQIPRHRTMLECLAPGLHGMLIRLTAKNVHAVGLLTAREREALRWAGAGKTTWEMARIMGISERTVVFHVRNVMQKLKARNRAHAIAKAAALGFLSGDL